MLCVIIASVNQLVFQFAGGGGMGYQVSPTFCQLSFSMSAVHETVIQFMECHVSFQIRKKHYYTQMFNFRSHTFYSFVINGTDKVGI